MSTNIKIKRAFFRLLSPLITVVFNLRRGISIGEVFYFGIPCIKGNVSINSGCLLSHYDANPLGILSPCRFFSEPQGSIEIGKNFRASGVVIYSSKSVVIGDNVMIAPGVVIMDDDMHPLDFFARRNSTEKSRTASIYIGDDVWICMGATILKGSVIGDRSIIGANVTLSGAYPPDSTIVQPNPTVKHSH